MATKQDSQTKKVLFIVIGNRHKDDDCFGPRVREDAILRKILITKSGRLKENHLHAFEMVRNMMLRVRS
jgi:Ni,Fe-hydrogenase maturation factor